MAAISNSNTDFALELFRTLSRENPVGNVFVSPLSISAALAMVYLGARGDTGAQMAKVRHKEPIGLLLHKLLRCTNQQMICSFLLPHRLCLSAPMLMSMQTLQLSTLTSMHRLLHAF